LPELYAALAVAQGQAESLTRDRSGEHGRYTTSDEIASVARKLLSANGLAWLRVNVTLEAAGLADYDIGRQGYVGDAVESWLLVHSSGGSIAGTSRIPIVVSRGRPHDKAVGAGLTYDTGQTLRGLLCLDREDKDAVDRREDAPREHDEHDEPAPRPYLGPRCDAGPGRDIAEANKLLVAELARLHGIEDVRKAWRGAITRAGVDVARYAGTLDGPGTLTVADGRLVKAWIEGRLHALATEVAEDDRAAEVARHFNGTVEVVA
jgi:hypothetical protein